MVKREIVLRLGAFEVGLLMVLVFCIGGGADRIADAIRDADVQCVEALDHG